MSLEDDVTERRIRRRDLLVAAGCCAAAAPFLTLAACGARRDQAELRGRTMGTTYSLRVRLPTNGVDVLALHAEVGGIFRRIDALLSPWRRDSELARINAAATGDWVGVSTETERVVAAAQAQRRLSGGAFDATLGALVDLWGFGPSHSERAVPAAGRLDALRPRADTHGFETCVHPPRIRRRDPRARLDLSAIAQGHALDEVAALLVRRGLKNYLLDLGGELRAGGRAAAKRPWHVAVERPYGEGRLPLCVVRLEDAAIGTSGVYLKWFEDRGRRYSHILDPRSGEPLEHDLLSVTVIAQDALTADAMATTLLVLGPEEGTRFAREHGLAALFAAQDGRGVRVSRTPSFAARIVAQEDLG